MKVYDFLSSFQAMLAHANIKPCFSGCRIDRGFVYMYDAVDKKRTYRAKENVQLEKKNLCPLSGVS